MATDRVDADADDAGRNRERLLGTRVREDAGHDVSCRCAVRGGSDLAAPDEHSDDRRDCDDRFQTLMTLDFLSSNARRPKKIATERGALGRSWLLGMNRAKLDPGDLRQPQWQRVSRNESPARGRALQRGSPGWTRTNNPPVNSRMLCQLSYRGSLGRRAL